MRMTVLTFVKNNKAARFYPVPFLLLLAVFAPVLVELVSDWYNDPNYSHGFLVPLVSIYLFWTRREELSRIAVLSSPSGLLVITVGILLFIIANGAAEFFTVRLSFVIILIGLIQYLFGTTFVKSIWFELAFLLFMIPIPYVIYFMATAPMQLLASKVSFVSLNALGMDIVRQGNILHIPGYSLEVAEACSGLRSLISLLALGGLYAHLTQRWLPFKIILFLATIPLAIIANVFRVFATTVAAAFIGDEITNEPLHTLFGLSVFLVAFVGLFVLGRLLERIRA